MKKIIKILMILGSLHADVSGEVCFHNNTGVSLGFAVSEGSSSRYKSYDICNHSFCIIYPYAAIATGLTLYVESDYSFRVDIKQTILKDDFSYELFFFPESQAIVIKSMKSFDVWFLPLEPVGNHLKYMLPSEVTLRNRAQLVQQITVWQRDRCRNHARVSMEKL